MDEDQLFDRAAIIRDYTWARSDLHGLLHSATDDDLGRPSSGTRWTNEELLFHMVFGYVIVRTLLPLVRLVSRLPSCVGRTFSRLLNAGTIPFHLINFWGARVAARVFNQHRMGALMDWTATAILRRLHDEPQTRLAAGMPFPTRWDPFFEPVMSLGDVYRYPTQHYRFHRKQLTLPAARE